MTRDEPPFNTGRALQLIRLIPAPILAAIAGFALLKAIGIGGFWPELAGAVSGGYVLGLIARR
ncbi:hypothetical protein [Hyphobacterium sp.]|uniref:hypothetical protein n=1 Tax=Hyphobacterium sp. TaxID=2004662 RepID=UPI003BAC35FF